MLRAVTFPVRMAVGVIVLPLRYAFILVLRWKSPAQMFEGVRLSTWADGDSTKLFAKLAQVLTLIKQVDYHRYERLRRDVRRITVERLRTAGTFVPSLREIFLDAAHVENAPAEALALTIVHEATHARLHSFGIRVSETTRERIEHICIRQEASFAGRLGPDHADLVAAANAKVTLAYWTNDARNNRRIDELREAGLPAWFLRLYAGLFHS